MMAAEARRLPDGRLHLHHGPMDLILGADGTSEAVEAAFTAATARFAPLLEELVAELPALRSAASLPLHGATARRMAQAVAPHRPGFITPMAAVAGAVAETVLDVMPRPGLTRAHVNNGGDIALYLTPGTRYSAAIAGSEARVTIQHADPVRGIATSGWRGRSQSLGIADAVTVLAASAAAADAAATMIANAVDLPGHPGITRLPARQVKHDSDLGDLPVTIGVAPLTRDEAETALARGAVVARRLINSEVIAGAALFLHPCLQTLGQPLLAPMPEPCLG
ncbi:UPF0280 family protein [Gemmobacter lutimaris]|uniref:UPF0280 family protein n=1 Tax=Gemmobacter lutimaris TaxID=2306023 RepID=A0A398BU14_9RHOB|nr:UPF0280 family protein [Gemmobacter lutimaris]RID93037.1 UPF0280 family protein [Gemmobacter lutimaris]